MLEEARKQSLWSLLAFGFLNSLTLPYMLREKKRKEKKKRPVLGRKVK